MAGLFITFEGIDGVGKTTQIARLASRLRQAGVDVVLSREPGGTPVGEAIRELVLGRELHPVTTQLLFAAGRAEGIARVLVPGLGRGAVCLWDRYQDSTTAYQHYGSGHDRTVVDRICQISAGGYTPHKTLLLDADPRDIQKRLAGKDPDVYESKGTIFQERVRQGYLLIARGDPARVVVIDALQDPDEVAEQIWGIIAPMAV